MWQTEGPGLNLRSHHLPDVSPKPASLREEGSKANTFRNHTVHVPKQNDKYFTRCSLYNITAETSNFNN